ncbi:MAG TPA: hypothetical protein VHL14_00410 [Steroidobacteraceae bacterium]|nr:hypothetical protein [Steroidobacteraceae bacterium]
MSIPLHKNSLLQNAFFSWHSLTHSPPNYLFLLSHMRSYSTLLAHILGSSPEIDGYGETHVKYRNTFALTSLQRRVSRSIGHATEGRYLLDKILHNYVQSPDRLLDRSTVRTIIFIRKPESTLRSILINNAYASEKKQIKGVQAACDYYVSRLHRLRMEGERLGKDALYFQSESLISSPQALLTALSNWLNLGTPLRTEYEVGSRTGEAGFGDPSPNIRQGKILGPEASTIKKDIVIPRIVLHEAEAAYERCNDALQRSCQLLPYCKNVHQMNMMHRQNYDAGMNVVEVAH